MKSAILDTEKLVNYMRRKGLNTTAMAAKVGVSPSCLSRVLNNKRPPSGVVWSGLLGFFGKKVFDFIIFVDDVSNDKKAG
ncbi:helix-turn-helix domain-containing protein [Brevibacillus massiliensis]|uniref:helix-turn-helix domain-containing protein n=1 Tax=Brevibacillus massiliensis TaxID=1118054 RepID=UPI000361A186|nr:helix-turn-helix transcriptional regulator [Brevibacillus massiliensis]